MTGRTVPVVTSAVFINRVFGSSYHAWVEVYDDKLGWHSVDPTFCDGTLARKCNALPNLDVDHEQNGGLRDIYGDMGMTSLILNKDQPAFLRNK